jgi:hypothetical protein
VEIGSVAGPATELPSAARLQPVGSGQGSVPTRDIVAELHAVVTEIGRFRIDARPVPLQDVETAWRDTGTTQRVVITP